MFGGALEAKCEREHDFAEMFRLLGDGQAQEQIREATPDRRHCRVLAEDSAACLSCRLPENPYHPEKHKDWNDGMRALTEHSRVIYETMWLARMRAAGALADSDIAAGPPWWTEALFTHEHERKWADTMQASDYLAGKIADFAVQIINKMFAKR